MRTWYHGSDRGPADRLFISSPSPARIVTLPSVRAPAVLVALAVGWLLVAPGLSSRGIQSGGSASDGQFASRRAEHATDTIEHRDNPSLDEEPSALDAVSAAAIRGLRSDVDASIRAAGWPSSEWGVVAISLESGDTLIALNTARPMVPASNQKLITSAAALELLGPDFRYSTFLLARGPVVDGVLEGDLILFGTGDPTLEARDPRRPQGALGHFIDVLQASGIERIEGDVVGDGRFFDGPARHESWNRLDLNDWFAAPVSGLSFNENVVTMRLLPGRLAGDPPRVLTVPEGAGIPVVNRGLTVSSRPSPSLLIVRDDPDDPVEIRGQIHTGGGDVWRSITVSDPPAYAASLLRETLGHAGIQVRGRARAAGPTDPNPAGTAIVAAPAIQDGVGAVRTLALHRSPSLPELLQTLNKRSHNLYAETLLFTMGRTASGRGTFEFGAALLSDYLSERVGLDGSEFAIADGSGLSQLNRITPGGLVRVLSHMEASPVAPAFWASLPEAGNPRELNRMHRSPAANNLRAKTGTIDGTSALSGIVRSGSGEPVLFSIIANNVPSSWAAKRVEDRIGIRLAAFERSALRPELSPVQHGPGR